MAWWFMIYRGFMMIYAMFDHVCMVLDGLRPSTDILDHTCMYHVLYCQLSTSEARRATFLHAHHQMALFEIVYSQIQWSIIICIISPIEMA
jgi:hypothetical protein